MEWGLFIGSANLTSLALPLSIGLVIIVILFVLRIYLYRYIHKLALKTSTCFDDILVRYTRIASILWCIWIGIYTGWTIAQTPDRWMDMEDKVIPVLFVGFGIYTAIMLVMAFFKWYKVELCGRTKSTLDDIIMSVLIFGTPILGGSLGIILILRMLGYESEAVNTWLSLHLGKLLALIILLVILLLASIQIIPRLVQSGVRGTGTEQNEDESKKRADTLSGVITTTVQIVIIFLFLMMALAEFNINIAALITGAGIIGIAVGFGAQSLVKDIIAGLFVIMENQYRKGDVIRIADIAGVVEEINLRRTILRDLDGIIHVVPNGEIRVASNFTKMMSRVNLNISVAYDTDLDKAIAVINRVGEELDTDPQWSPLLLSTPKVLRVDNLGDSGIDIKILADTRPSQQWAITGELRLRLKKAFDKEGIEIPWPHTKVYFGNTPPPWPTENRLPNEPDKKNPGNAA
ncbi:MAG: mechanosensitive ion channel family protein [Dehalococcoidales bacterium]|nr:mechanosensitive ion channel family protein [Dehalococcoidales bacterium]